jgi:hypothetical protein
MATMATDGHHRWQRLLAFIGLLTVIQETECYLPHQGVVRPAITGKFSIPALFAATTDTTDQEFTRLRVLSDTPRILGAGGKALNLPHLTRRDKQELAAGERIQMQYREGRSGRGLVVLDVPVAPERVFSTLTLFDR